MKARILQLMRYASAHYHDFRSRGNKQSGYTYVAEFPRSGANWMRDMLGDCLQVPVPRFTSLPITFDAVLQTHSAKPIIGPKVVYMVRDGRDVLVSHYYKSVNSIISGSADYARRTKSRHPSLNASHEALQAGERLPRFYEEWKLRSAGAKVGWGEHVNAWLKNPPASQVMVRYEDLHADAHGTLGRAVEGLTGNVPKDYVLDFAIRRNSFEEKTGRKPGEVDNSSNRRSGRPGGWKAALSEELKQQFLHDFGSALERCGYATTETASSAV